MRKGYMWSRLRRWHMLAEAYKPLRISFALFQKTQHTKASPRKNILKCKVQIIEHDPSPGFITMNACNQITWKNKTHKKGFHLLVYHYNKGGVDHTK